jgi:hypothetical protein
LFSVFLSRNMPWIKDHLQEWLMADTQQARVKQFQDELESAITHYRSLAKRAYRQNIGLVSATLVTSLAAGMLGVLTKVDQKYIGAIALLPGFFAACSTTLRLQAKANQHYRRKDALQLLRNRLLFELPEAPTASDIAELSKAWGVLTDRMNDDWEKSLNPYLHEPEVNQQPKTG